MLKNVAQIVSWYARLGAKFLRVVPLGTVGVLMLTLMSQVALLGAFLLPLKIVMLLGSDKAPRMLPDAIASYDHETLVLSLSALAFFCFLLKNVTDRSCEKTSNYGAQRLLAQTRKLVLFENQDVIASNVYLKYVEALSGFVFSALALAVVAYFYFSMAVVISLYIFVAIVASIVLLSISEKFRDIFEKRQPEFVKTISGVGFFSVFAFIIFDFLYFVPPNFSLALVSVILTRQMISRLGVSVRHLLFLRKQEDKINALFFHGKVYDPSSAKETESVWGLLKESEINIWMSRLLSECLREEVPEFHVKWHEGRESDIIMLRVSEPQQGRDFIVRLFGAKKTAIARHEAALLSDPPEFLPAPKMALITDVFGFHCHVFETTNLRFIEEAEFSAAEKKLNACLMGVEPPGDLVERYQRSKLMLWDRIDKGVFERLRLITDKEERDIVDRFRSSLLEIKARLKALPPVITAPIERTMVMVSADDGPLLVDWGNWRIEPAGARWDVANGENLELKEAIISAKEHRNFDGVDGRNCEVAALIYKIATRFEKQKYREVLGLLSRLLESEYYGFSGELVEDQNTLVDVAKI